MNDDQYKNKIENEIHVTNGFVNQGDYANITLSFGGEPTKEPRQRALKIFINHRRTASSHFAGRLYDTLKESFGDSVFLDVENIGAGEIIDPIKKAIRECDYFLCVISEGTFDRIFEDNDWVRLEIELALKYERIIVLIADNNVSYPKPNTLPESIQKLSFYNGCRIQHDKFSTDVQRLVSNYLK